MQEKQHVKIPLETVEKFSEQLHTGEKSLATFGNLPRNHYPDISGLDLTGMNLREANLTYSLCHHTNFRDCDLSDASLVGAQGDYANYTNATVQDTGFQLYNGKGVYFVNTKGKPRGNFDAINKLKTFIIEIKDLLENANKTDLPAPYSCHQSLLALNETAQSTEEKKIYKKAAENLVSVYGGLATLPKPIAEQQSETLKSNLTGIKFALFHPQSKTVTNRVPKYVRKLIVSKITEPELSLQDPRLDWKKKEEGRKNTTNQETVMAIN